MIHTCAKNEANQGGSCISGVSVLRKVTLNCDWFSSTSYIQYFSGLLSKSLRENKSCVLLDLEGGGGGRGK